MKFTQYLGLFLASSVAASPSAEFDEEFDSAVTSELQTRAGGVTDIDILNFALTLEHLEDTFYRRNLKRFGKAAFDKAGFKGGVRKNVAEVSKDESTHVKFLTSVIKSLGKKPVMACTYDFGVKNVDDFLAVAEVLEGVGVSAYLGAAALISNKDYLTPAGSILTVEARHNAYIRKTNKQSPFPAAFDVPLTPNEVYTLASPFIKSCPKSNPALPVKAFPALTVAKGTSFKPGAVVTLTSKKALDSKKKYHGAFITVEGPIFTKTTVVNAHTVKVTVPKSPLVPGQAYVVLNSNAKKVTDNSTVAGPAIVPVV